MSVAGLILSNLHDGELPMLTAKRTMGAVPFGGRFRLLDFPLSAMVNAGISEIFVVAHHNYRSLMEHIGSGKDWDMARHQGGIHILPPYSAAYANPEESYNSRLQSLVSVCGVIDRIAEEHVLCCDCDAIGTPDIGALIAAHKKSGLPMTVCEEEGGFFGSLHVWIAKTSFLRELLREAQRKRYRYFYDELIREQMRAGKVGTYRFAERFYRIHSLADYYRLHMLLVSNEDVRRTLLECEDRPLMTKIRNSPPVKYGTYARVEGALIADGCVIEGTVRNSVLFRGVHVGEGCVVEDSVILEHGSLTGRVSLHAAVLDKHVVLGGGVSLSGHATLPFFVEEGRVIC